MKLKWLDRAVMQGVHLTLCTSQKEFDVICKHIKIPNEPWLSDSHNACVHSYQDGTKVICVVCMELSADDPCEKAGMLVHEATHVKQRLMTAIGEDQPSKEFEAHTMQNISMRLFDEYAKRLRKLNK